MSSLTDNTAKWGVRKLTKLANKFQGNSGLPVGFEYFSTNPNIPVGSIPLFGGEYSREIYSDLWSWVQEQAGYLIEESVWQEKSAANGGNVPFYSTGDGTTTFRVPSLNCWVKGANGIEEVGSYLSAGLPNITGTIESRPHTSGNTQYGGAVVSASGAFTYTRMASTTTNTGCAESSTQSGNDVTTFSAQTSNPIYGNSDTVQPKSIVGMWLVKAYGTFTNVGSTDVANIASGLTKVETRMSAMEDTYNGYDFITDSYVSGFNWWRKWKSGWLEQGGLCSTPQTYTNIVTFLKPFVTPPVKCYVTYLGVTIPPNYAHDDGSVSYREVFPQAITATQFYLYGYTFGNENADYKGIYYACGQGA